MFLAHTTFSTQVTGVLYLKYTPGLGLSRVNLGMGFHNCLDRKKENEELHTGPLGSDISFVHISLVKESYISHQISRNREMQSYYILPNTKGNILSALPTISLIAVFLLISDLFLLMVFKIFSFSLVLWFHYSVYRSKVDLFGFF